ncbi:hypothetical protein EX30DRAFT_343827 [Ascodesmis nigricans]|uniref:Ribonuclease n=1 Tax=Ascodesmis nigricans TaxID=341454 RepID=A0A4S2MQT7_9PEZI|nr:hypothetical protein EX30DRAFT_343827 [Ascodesmis nigricans]
MAESPTKDAQSQDLDIPLSATFIPPSITRPLLSSSTSYTHHSPHPPILTSSDDRPPCILGVDEAGRGPVLGPMVYAVAYTPLNSSHFLKSHSFDDSKKLTASFRSQLFHSTCTPSHDLHTHVGWSCTLLSARDISSGMLRPNTVGAYNLNAQAHDTTARLIREVIESGVNVAEIYVDTVGVATSYQAKLQKQFPGAKVTVAKKADSLYPIVSAASVVAKVTRDAAIEVLAEMEQEEEEKVEEDPEANGEDQNEAEKVEPAEDGKQKGKRTWDKVVEMGSGYPGDDKTKKWLKSNMDPVFGFGNRAVRFSWRTVADMMDGKGANAVGVEWEEDVDDGDQRITGFFTSGDSVGAGNGSWYGVPVKADSF